MPGASSLFPHIVLVESGLSFDAVKVDEHTKVTDGGGDYRSVNPLGYVPALQLEDGSVLTEAASIAQYVADRVPAKKLAPPNGTLDRAKLQSWLNFISSELQLGCFCPIFDREIPVAVKAIFPPASRQPARPRGTASRSERVSAGQRLLNRGCVPLRRIELGTIGECRFVPLSQHPSPSKTRARAAGCEDDDGKGRPDSGRPVARVLARLSCMRIQLRARSAYAGARSIRRKWLSWTTLLLNAQVLPVRSQGICWASVSGIDREGHEGGSGDPRLSTPVAVSYVPPTGCPSTVPTTRGHPLNAPARLRVRHRIPA